MRFLQRRMHLLQAVWSQLCGNGVINNIPEMCENVEEHNAEKDKKSLLKLQEKQGLLDWSPPSDSCS